MYYFVEPWDSVEIIARKFGISTNQLFLYNPLAYNQPIYIGQKLFIPLPFSKAKRNKNTSDIFGTIAQKPDYSMSDTNNSTQFTTYTVKIGDSLESIAEHFNMTVEEIMRLNGLANEMIAAGDELLIRTSRGRDLHGAEAQSNSMSKNNNIGTIGKYTFSYIHDLYLNKDIDIWKEIGYKNAYFFVSKMAITAVGAPNAFHKDNSLALDYLANAGIPGYWWSLVTEPHGYPMVQNYPYPGYYISKTALSDCDKEVDDPTRYVDARLIPYITLPTHHMLGAELGDLSVVVNTENGKIAYATIADVGPDDSVGIGSIALAEELGINPDAKRGGAEDGILYIVFPQSGKEASRLCYVECYRNCKENCEEICDKECHERLEKLWCKTKTREQIISEAQPIFQEWGGMGKVHALFGDFPLTHTKIKY